jgi:hypothetical protein
MMNDKLHDPINGRYYVESELNDMNYDYHLETLITVSCFDSQKRIIKTDDSQLCSLLK